MDTPERLVWPFWPRPAVLPRPEPIPRPTRTRLLRAPGLSRSSLSFILSALAFAFVALRESPSPLCGRGVGERGLSPPLPLTSFATLSRGGERAKTLRRFH